MKIPETKPPEYEDLEKVSGILFEYEYSRKVEAPKKDDD